MMTNTTMSYLLQQVSLLYGLQYVLLGRFLSLPSQQEFIQNEVGFLKVEYNVKLTNLLDKS